MARPKKTDFDLDIITAEMLKEAEERGKNSALKETESIIELLTKENARLAEENNSLLEQVTSPKKIELVVEDEISSAILPVMFKNLHNGKFVLPDVQWEKGETKLVSGTTQATQKFKHSVKLGMIKAV